MRAISLFILFLIAGTANAQLYFDQQFPSDTPAVFAPGIVSNEWGNRDIAISPEGDELFYTIQYGRGLISAIMHSKKINGKWSEPDVALFSGMYNDLEPAFSADGEKLFFVSNRPLSNEGKPKDYDVWFVIKKNGAWGNAQNIGAPVNSDKDEFYPSLTKKGDIYFTRAVDGREEDILFCKYANNKYEDAQALPDAINSVNDEFNAFIDPDEQFIIFSIYGRNDDNGGGDLYISKKDEKGEWMKAINLKTPFNSKYLDYCPYITPDKKYFFFTSNRHSIKIPFNKKQTIRSLEELLHSPLNGSDNIYWVNASVILK